jgi:hypothetical protein
MKAPERRRRQEGAFTLKEAFLRSSNRHASPGYLPSLDLSCSSADGPIDAYCPASFEFMIQIPSTSPCRDYCRSGSVSWEVLAAADLVKEKPSSKGGGLLSKLAAVPSAGVGLLEDRQELYLYSIPSDEGELLSFPPLVSIFESHI